MKGWIKLHRKLLEWEWADNPIVFHLFIHLLLSANHKEKLWRGNKVKKGQFITGLYSLSEQTGISIQSLRTALKKLELTKEITRKSTNKFSIITIVKWEQYQVLEQELTINQQTTNKQLTTTNNDNNVKNVYNISDKSDTSKDNRSSKTNSPLQVSNQSILKDTKGGRTKTRTTKKISARLVDTLLQVKKMKAPDGDYTRDNIFPARSLSKKLGELIKERTGKDATDDDKIARFKFILNHLQDFDKDNATKISYFTRNWNRIINKLTN